MRYHTIKQCFKFRAEQKIARACLSICVNVKACYCFCTITDSSNNNIKDNQKLTSSKLSPKTTRLYWILELTELGESLSVALTLMTWVPVATASEMETVYTSCSNSGGLSLTSSNAMFTRASVDVPVNESDARTV